jgi:hypothetical protein
MVGLDLLEKVPASRQEWKLEGARPYKCYKFVVEDIDLPVIVQ